MALIGLSGKKILISENLSNLEIIGNHVFIKIPEIALNKQFIERMIKEGLIDLAKIRRSNRKYGISRLAGRRKKMKVA